MADRRVRLTGIQRKVAENVSKSVATIPHVTTVREVRADVLLQARERGREIHGRVTVMPFIIRAVVSALAEFPVLNATLDENEIIFHEDVNLGIAVDAGGELVVTGGRGVAHETFGKRVGGLRDVAGRARSRKLEPAGFRGGNFTVSNSGALGGEIFTPIINYPQSGILGLGKIQRKPVVDEDGSIVAREMMYLCLSYDHRIVNGREAVSFLSSVAHHLFSDTVAAD